MNIYAKKGSKVIYLDENGHDYQREDANTILKKGQVYTVLETEVHSYTTDVFLEEYPGRRFNSVMFEDSNETKT